jgi:hypothetical protein
MVGIVGDPPYRGRDCDPAIADGPALIYLPME